MVNDVRGLPLVTRESMGPSRRAILRCIEIFRLSHHRFSPWRRHAGSGRHRRGCGFGPGSERVGVLVIGAIPSVAEAELWKGGS